MVNSTFALHLVVVVLDCMIIDVFGGYGILLGIVSKSMPVEILIGSIVWISFHVILKMLMAYSGSSTTAEAEKSQVLVSKMIINSKADKQMKSDLNLFLNQMKCRNKKLSNTFFTISYNVVVVVSFFYCLIFLNIKFLDLQTFSTIVTYLVIICQFDSSKNPK